MADARSRLTDTQRSLEETLTALKATEGETSASRDKARSMELRTAEALREAAEERRRARREHEEIVTNARKEADRILDRLRDEVRAVRESLQRESLTVPAIDDALAEAEAVAAELPVPDDEPAPPLPPTPRDVASRRACPEPDRRLGGADRRARARRDAGVARGRRDPGDGGRGRPGPGGRGRAERRRRAAGALGRRWTAAGPWPSRWICAARGSRTRSTRSIATSTRPAWRASQGRHHPRAGDRGAA